MTPEALTNPTQTHPGAPQHNLTSLVPSLLKVVLYREDDATQWAAVLQLQARVRDCVAVLALALVVERAVAALRPLDEPVGLAA